MCTFYVRRFRQGYFLRVEQPRFIALPQHFGMSSKSIDVLRKENNDRAVWWQWQRRMTHVGFERGKKIKIKKGVNA
jgi:hypothetical protein